MRNRKRPIVEGRGHYCFGSVSLLPNRSRGDITSLALPKNDHHDSIAMKVLMCMNLITSTVTGQGARSLNDSVPLVVLQSDGTMRVT